MKVLVIIPAYNEAENIVRVVDNLIENYPQYDYIVINDGSRDRTADICHSHHYRLLDLPINLGLSGAFQAGMRYAYTHDYDAVIQLDGDGQHDPCYIADMIHTMEDSHCDIVIASRFLKKRKPFSPRMLGSRLLTASIFIATGKKITDPTAGMRLYNKKMITLFARNMNFGPEPDTISYLIHAGISYQEMQVEMHERIAGTSYLTVVRSLRYMLNMCISTLFVQLFRSRRI